MEAGGNVAEHPITPPPELVAKLWREASAGRDDAPIGEIFNHGVLLAYAAGADQELEACCEWFEDRGPHPSMAADVRSARRPKPPSLKEQALARLTSLEELAESMGHSPDDTIRRALEQLND